MAVLALVAVALSGGPMLGPTGIGAVRFGVNEPAAVSALSDRFGPPSARGVNTGCGPRYTEVEWGDLVAEFRLGRFSGFRYLVGGYPLTTPGSPQEPAPPAVAPTLTTSGGITLGSPLARLRASYRPLRVIGVDRWRARGGLVFVARGSAQRIVEIKLGTCGDF
jgi:hypothetical protein